MLSGEIALKNNNNYYIIRIKFFGKTEKCVKCSNNAKL